MLDQLPTDVLKEILKILPDKEFTNCSAVCTLIRRTATELQNSTVGKGPDYSLINAENNWVNIKDNFLKVVDKADRVNLGVDKLNKKIILLKKNKVLVEDNKKLEILEEILQKLSYWKDIDKALTNEFNSLSNSLKGISIALADCSAVGREKSSKLDRFAKLSQKELATEKDKVKKRKQELIGWLGSIRAAVMELRQRSEKLKNDINNIR